MQHTEGKFTGRNNYNLYRQAWLPDGIPSAVLIGGTRFRGPQRTLFQSGELFCA